jgi:predicted nicotinamide N-methyase
MDTYLTARQKKWLIVQGFVSLALFAWAVGIGLGIVIPQVPQWVHTITLADTGAGAAIMGAINGFAVLLEEASMGQAWD